MTDGYVELHAASAFSFLEGGSLPETLAQRAFELDSKIGLRTINAKAETITTAPGSVKPSSTAAALCLPTRFTSGKS
jgi:hypothetical protein